jgi:hypothetical protein
MSEEYVTKIAETGKRILSKMSEIGEEVEKRAFDISRGLTSLSISVLAIGSTVIALASLFPVFLSTFAGLIPFLVLAIQLGVTIMIVSLVIGVSRRLIR